MPCEVGITCTPGDAHEERVAPSLECSAYALGKGTTTDCIVVTKIAGTNFLCTFPVHVLGSPRGSLGDRGRLCAISLPDEFAAFL